MLGSFMKVVAGPTKTKYNQATGALDTQYDEGHNFLAPFRDAGTSALSSYQDLLKNPGQITNNPGYQFRKTEGANTISNNALARGGFFHGNTAREMEEYGQNFASAELDKSLSRYLPLLQTGYGAAGGSASAAFNQGNVLAQLFSRQTDQNVKAKEAWKNDLGEFGDSLFNFAMGGMG